LATAAALAGSFGAATASAHQSPASCSTNGLVLTLVKDRTLVRNGETSNYTVSVDNDETGACDITNATVTLTLPAGDGTATGRTVTLATDATFAAGASNVALGTVPYVVAINPGVSDAIAEAKVSGVLHDAPVDHTAQIAKTVGTDITQPVATLTETATPAQGQSPLPVTFAYTVTNGSTTPVPMSDVRVAEEKCLSGAPNYRSGDVNGNSRLDNGEAWTYSCAMTLRDPGSFTSTATATANSTVDSRAVPIAPASATVNVTPSRRQILRQDLPRSNAAQSRRDAQCMVAATSRRMVRARQRTTLRVTVRDGDAAAAGVLVRVVGPGLTRRTVTNARGAATLRLRPTRSGTLVVQTTECAGADRIRVRAARRTSAQQAPRNTG
jgi:uncharacterized repeat protein (TIGR01451 family)